MSVSHTQSRLEVKKPSKREHYKEVKVEQRIKLREKEVMLVILKLLETPVLRILKR